MSETIQYKEHYGEPMDDMLRRLARSNRRGQGTKLTSEEVAFLAGFFNRQITIVTTLKPTP